jgi:2-polyprenyl-6-methoxyphenol hydroxylase-like FAD-dependent oxidoreductase
VTLRVLIAGAGVGGLCLAQGLRKRGVQVTVYERDLAAVTRGQGYRLRIDAVGIRALARCLPDDLFQLFQATSNQPYMSRGAAFDHLLNQISVAAPDRPFDPAAASTAVNRLTLRQVLLAGLDDAVCFGRELVHVVEHETGVRAHFAAGEPADGDLLVGADGINSAVRRIVLPQAKLIDTGLRGIYGQAPLDGRLLEILPPTLFGGSAPVLGPDRRTLALGSFQPRMPLAAAAVRLAPYARLEPVPDYMKWTMVAPAGSFGRPEEELWQAEPATLHALGAQLTHGWHPALLELVARSEVATTFFLAIRSAHPVPAWRPRLITLLGDAIHATTPVGGTGANTALRDAALLASCLAEVAAAQVAPRAAVAQYEEQMREYGFKAVTDSLRGAEKIFRANVPALS